MRFEYFNLTADIRSNVLRGYYISNSLIQFIQLPNGQWRSFLHPKLIISTWKIMVSNYRKYNVIFSGNSKEQLTYNKLIHHNNFHDNDNKNKLQQ